MLAEEQNSPFREKFTRALTKDDLELDQWVTILKTDHGDLERKEVRGEEKPVGVMKNELEHLKGEVFIVEALSFPYVMLRPVSLKRKESISVDLRGIKLGELSDQFVGATMAQEEHIPEPEQDKPTEEEVEGFVGKYENFIDDLKGNDDFDGMMPSGIKP